MKKWEYRAYLLPNVESITKFFLEEINAYGEQGWELMQIVHDNSGMIVIFKREKAA